MNHDPKYNEFEYEKENYPKTPEHFKQFVAAQVTKELSKASIVKHRARKKYFPAKVAAAVIVCAAVGTTGAYAGVKQYSKITTVFARKQDVSLHPETSPKKKLLLFPTTQIPYHQLPLYLKKTDLLLLFLIPGRMLCWKCMIMTVSTKNSQINI